VTLGIILRDSLGDILRGHANANFSGFSFAQISVPERLRKRVDQKQRYANGDSSYLLGGSCPRLHVHTWFFFIDAE
jgi:hypothetical protein